MRIRATAKETYTGYHQIFLKRPAQLLTGLIVLRTISAQARFAPREALLQLRRSERGYYFDDTRWFLSNFQVRMISSTSMFLRISAVKASKGAARRTLWMAA